MGADAAALLQTVDDSGAEVDAAIEPGDAETVPAAPEAETLPDSVQATESE